MYRNYESFTPIETDQKTTKIIDYPGLVDSVQLSVARLIDIDGSIEAESFAEVLASYPEEEHERIISEIGWRFDDALISFVTASLISNRHERVVILANSSEGINGDFPWQPKLEQHVHHLKLHGYIPGVELRIERYSTDDNAIESFSEELDSLAA